MKLRTYASMSFSELFINLKRFYGLIKLYKNDVLMKSRITSDALDIINKGDKIFVIFFLLFTIYQKRDER